jgi:hypothetical protein
MVTPRVSDTTCTLELGAPTLDVLASRILWLGVDFEVITPDALRLHLQTLAARLGRASITQGAPLPKPL